MEHATAYTHTAAEEERVDDPKPERASTLSYLEQDCPLTLRQGLQEYYTQIEGLITEDNASVETAALFRYHDTCHVLFGSDTSIPGEMLADSWILWGTDETLRSYMKYLDLAETKAILEIFKDPRIILKSVISIPLMGRAWWRTRRMTAKWPYRDHEQYLDTPLRELRDRFNIRVVSV